jgi:hypothetical protein
MNADHEIFIDEPRFLPQILSTRFFERAGWIEVPSDLEDAGANRWESSLNVLYDAVIERVDSAVRVRFPNNPDDQRLDGRRLYLDVNAGSRWHCIENCSERRNPDSAALVKLADLDRRKLCDSELSAAWHTTGVEEGIMMNDNRSILRCMNVELDCIRSHLERSEKGRNGILRKCIVSPAMRDALRTAPGWWGQCSLRVSSFRTMSAEGMSTSSRGQSALTVDGRERLPDEAQ